MGTIARSVRKGCEERCAKSEWRPRTYHHEYSAASLAGSVALGGANANDGAGLARRQNSKRLCRFLVEGRHALAQIDAQPGPGRNRSGWCDNVVPVGRGDDRPRFCRGAYGFANVKG